MVSTAIRHFAGTRYSLREWVVMPNHGHVVVTPLDSQSLSSILHSWKSFTATAINRHLVRSGALWQKESFDHIVRSAEQLERIEQYIHDNPRGLTADQYTLGCIHKE
jgi:putative DNA methylase